MTDIFFSHATKDKHLAEKLVDLLKEGIGVPDEAIFCSSLDGHGIPFGDAQFFGTRKAGVPD